MRTRHVHVHLHTDAAKPPPGLYYGAHRGYLIRQNLDGRFYITKDGHYIASAASLDAAKAIIDQLLD
jgi:hypothetical protein